MGKLNCSNCKKDISNENCKKSKVITNDEYCCEKCYDKLKKKKETAKKRV